MNDTVSSENIETIVDEPVTVIDIDIARSLERSRFMDNAAHDDLSPDEYAMAMDMHLI